MQDVILTVIEQQEKFQGESSIKTWVFSIASNKAKDYLRKRSRWPNDLMDKAKEQILVYSITYSK